MSTRLARAAAGVGTPALASAARTSALILVAALGGAVVAYLTVNGLWYVAAALLLALPALILLHRYPFAAVIIWLLVLPLIEVTESGAVRRLFWLVHRALPVAALIVVLIAPRLGLSDRRLPRLGLPEALMAGYVAASATSIVFTSPEPAWASFVLYDRVVIPMCLYLLVRLLEPDEADLRRLLFPIVFLLLTQSAIGLVSLSAPDVLPAAWLGKGGERMTGALRAPEVFGTTVLFCGLFLLHRGVMAGGGPLARGAKVMLFVASLLIVFLTFSRASWVAGIVAVAGVLLVYRAWFRHLLLVGATAGVLVLASGILAQYAEYAEQRLYSEQSQESALSRLPVVQASVRMFEARPILGWGYETFDWNSLQFQGRVGDLIVPRKFHSSHNLFLTILAEQGVVGFLLFFGPVLYWLRRTIAGRRSGTGSPADHLMLRTLWLAFAGFLIVNTSYRMQTAFAFGLWWLTLGLIAVLVTRTRRGTAHPRPPSVAWPEGAALARGGVRR